MGEIFIVSNRGPFTISREFIDQARRCLEKGTPPEPKNFGEGGLVSAMAGLLKPGPWNTTWVGASMGDREIDVARGHYRDLFKKMVDAEYAPDLFPHIEIDPDNRMHFRYAEYDFFMRFVFFDTRHMRGYYSNFANGFLWPLMHLTRQPLFYKKARAFPRPRFEKNDFIQYLSSAVTFANTIIDEILKHQASDGRKNDIIVWNQDYHLMHIAEVYPSLLHEHGLSDQEMKPIHVGQFMHTPFFNIHEIQGLIREDKRKMVKAEIYDPFPESIESVLQKLVWGMLSNDFIGFHTKEYCDHYLEALEEWFPVDIRVNGQFYEISHQDSVTTVGAFPIGLDVDKISSEVEEGKALEHNLAGESLSEKIHRDRTAGKIIFGGLERCDYTKGLLERLWIFSHALNQLRHTGKDACFYQVTSPSRSENPDYQNLDTLLEKDIRKVNRKLRGGPIIHIPEGLPTPQNYRFMKEIDVMLVTPLEDGMNLVAFEYILSQKYRSPSARGMLVLSTSGASRVLKEKGFGEEDGVVHVDVMKTKEAGESLVKTLQKGRRLSQRIIDYVVTERRVDDWAKKNLEAIMNAGKNA